MIGMLIFGTANTVILKKQDDFVTGTKEGAALTFNHPYFQCLNMFIGEFVCLFVYIGKV